MRSLNRPSLAWRLAAALLAGVLAACSSSTGPLAPFQPQIANVPGNFQFQATGVTNVTWTYTYAWANAGDSATVNNSTTTTAGSAVLSVYDQNSARVYSDTLRPSGTVGTLKGVTGTWTIKVVFLGYSGTPNFRVQKAP